jgi:hypothetical protein
VKHPFPIDGTPISFEREILTKDLFAVVEFSGSQFKVTVVSGITLKYIIKFMRPCLG